MVRPNITDGEHYYELCKNCGTISEVYLNHTGMLSFITVYEGEDINDCNASLDDDSNIEILDTEMCEILYG